MGLSKFKDEEFITLLQDAVQHVQNDEDLIEITRLKHLFKKAVPLTRRSYVGCYFAKLMLEQGGRSRGENSRGRGKDAQQQQQHNRRQDSARREQPDKGSREDVARDKQQQRRAIIDDTRASLLFISIGKKRRVFPRDMVSLLTQTAHIPADRIGDIRVFDNYSFVQVFTEDADNVIAALNGYKFHGRELGVSYSRKKEESAAAAEDALQNDPPALDE
jgi:RNA recognition motif-containing protein